MALLEKANPGCCGSRIQSSDVGLAAEFRQRLVGRIHRDRQGRARWLDGVVYGPWTRVTLAKLRSMVPERYPIRRYPDITHSLMCEFPVPDWDIGL